MISFTEVILVEVPRVHCWLVGDFLAIGYTLLCAFLSPSCFIHFLIKPWEGNLDGNWTWVIRHKISWNSFIQISFLWRKVCMLFSIGGAKWWWIGSVHIGWQGEVPWGAVGHKFHRTFELTPLLCVEIKDALFPMDGLIQEPAPSLGNANALLKPVSWTVHHRHHL